MSPKLSIRFTSDLLIVVSKTVTWRVSIPF